MFMDFIQLPFLQAIIPWSSANFLREQIRAINRELGDRESSNVDDYTIRLAGGSYEW